MAMLGVNTEDCTGCETLGAEELQPLASVAADPRKETRTEFTSHPHSNNMTLITQSGLYIIFT